MKKETQNYIITQIRRDLKGLRIEKPVKLYYHFYEPNRKRDLDNIASFAMKCVQDSLVLSKVLKNDGWNEIVGFNCEFAVDSAHPRIVVDILEMDE